MKQFFPFGNMCRYFKAATFLFLHTFSCSAFAQITLTCGQFAVRIERLSNTPPCSGGAECGKEFLKVSLRTQNLSQVHGNQFSLAYKTLSVSTSFSSDGSPTLSSINESETLNCCAFQNVPFSVEKSSNSAVLMIDNLQEDYQHPIIFNWVSNFYEADLYTMVVDAYPGEMITPSIDLFSYLQPSGGSCNAIPPADIIPPTFSIGPFTDDTHLCLELSAFDQGSNSMELTISNNGAFAQFIQYLDYTFSIKTAFSMVTPMVSCGGMTITPFKKIGKDYFFRISHKNLQVQPGQKPLCTIHMEGPVLKNQKAESTVCFENGLIRYQSLINGLVCLKPCFGGCKTAEWGEDEFCDPNLFTLTVEPFTEQSPACTPPTYCGDLAVRIRLDWPLNDAAGQPIPNTLQFTEFRFGLDFAVPAAISIAGLLQNNCSIPNAFPMPTSGPACTVPSGNAGNATFNYSNNAVNYCAMPIGLMNITRGSSMHLLFQGQPGCIDAPIFNLASIRPKGQNSCIPNLVIQGFSHCNPEITGKIRDESNNMLPDHHNISITQVGGGCSVPINDTHCADYGVCVCNPGAKYIVEPISANDDWTNGVSTYDLVLISKHILGSQPFNTTYKYIAGDVNKSNNVSTADIVDLRKLILGIIPVFPNNNSWRFIDKSQAIIISSPPQVEIGNVIENRQVSFPVSDIDFVAVKIGDINGDHETNCMPPFAAPKTDRRSIVEVTSANPFSQGDIISVPIRHNGQENWEAVQLGLQFDASKWVFIGTSKGDVESVTQSCFGLQKAGNGEIRFSWFDATSEAFAEPGQILFWVTLKVKSTFMQYAAPIFVAQNSILENQSWMGDGTAFSLTVEPVIAERDNEQENEKTSSLQVKTSENPFSGQLNIEVKSPIADQGVIWAFNSAGQLVHFQKVELAERSNFFSIDKAKEWPAGVYVVKVKAGGKKVEARAVKI